MACEAVGKEATVSDSQSRAVSWPVHVSCYHSCGVSGMTDSDLTLLVCIGMRLAAGCEGVCCQSVFP